MHKPVIILDPGHGGWTSFFYDLDNGVRLEHTWNEVAHLDPSEKMYFSSGEARRWRSGELAIEPRFYFERNGRKVTYGDPGDLSPLDPQICEKDLVLDVARSVHREVGRALLAKATRDRDGYVAAASRVTYANRVRAKLGRPTLLLSLHTASSTDPEDRGLRIARTPETPERTVEPFREQLSRYRDTLRDGFAIDTAGARLEGWPGLEAPAISVELGFLTHLDDARRLLDRSLRQELARCLAAAAVEALHSRPGPARDVADRPALASPQAALHSGTAP